MKKFLKKITLTVSFSMNKDDTNEMMDVFAPTPHWLQTWGDTNPVTNILTLIQPTILQIFDTRQLQDSLIIWGRMKYKNYYDFFKTTWERNIIPESNVSSFNEAFFHGIAQIKNKKLKKKL